jgi:hypothetical protein
VSRSQHELDGRARWRRRDLDEGGLSARSRSRQRYRRCVISPCRAANSLRLKPDASSRGKTERASSARTAADLDGQIDLAPSPYLATLPQPRDHAARGGVTFQRTSRSGRD